MKIICLKNHLKEAISLSEKITGKNLSLPILNNVLISAENNRNLKFTATNLELGIEIEIPARVEKKGRLTVPAGIINNFLTNFSGEENIKIEAQNNNLLISVKNSSTIIKGQIADDFPVLPQIKTDNQISLSAKDLINGLKAVWYACSSSNIKPEISSIFLFSGKNNPLTLAATDSFRLAEKKFKYSFQNLHSLMIPFKAAAEIIRIFDKPEENLKIFSDKNQISIEGGNVRFISRLTEGVFPDYQQIIPRKFTTDVILDKNVFINSLKTAGIFSGKLNELSIIVGSKDNLITIKTSSADIGEHITHIPAKITGDELKIAFNHKYISDCLPHIVSSKILLRFSGEGKPLLITGAEDTSFQYLVMPMNTM